MKTAQYSAHYFPANSAIIASFVDSPANRLQKRYQNTFSKEDIARSVPPLNRLSDALWTVWKLLTPANARSLRWIGHDIIVNQDTVTITQNIFDAEKHTHDVPWPGLTYGLDKDEGLAMLGMPNRLGIAWLMINHHRFLGERLDLKVTIWSVAEAARMADISDSEDDEGAPDHICLMLWDLGE